MRLHADEVERRHSRVTLLLWYETVWYSLLKMSGAEILGIDIYLTKDAVRTQVVQSAYMVVVLVGYEDGIDMMEWYGQHLLAEVRTAVEENMFPVDFEQG